MAFFETENKVDVDDDDGVSSSGSGEGTIYSRPSPPPSSTSVTQRRFREFSTVTIDYQSMTDDGHSIVTVLKSRNVITDQILFSL